MPAVHADPREWKRAVTAVCCRLHLLSSGGAAGTRCATWRYSQRGGYSSHDDPALRLRVAHPAILTRLAARHLFDLPLGLYTHYLLASYARAVTMLSKVPPHTRAPVTAQLYEAFSLYVFFIHVIQTRIPLLGL